MPSGTKGSWKRALGAANTRSQWSSIVLPMPTAGPPTAATTGFFMFGSVSKSARAGEGPGLRPMFRKSATSLPAVKQSALPGRSTARTCGAASAAASAAPSCAYISAVMAFFLSRRSNRTRATRLAVSLLIKAIILELLAQRELGELARGRVGQLVHEDHVVRHPPLRDLALVETQQLVPGDVLPRLFDGDDDRALVPLRVAHPDHRRLGDRRMRDGDVLEIDRADPLAARLDHVLRAVGDLDITLRIDGADIAGGKPAVLERVAALAFEVAFDHPRTPHLQVAERLAVPWQLASILVDDAQIHAEDGAALLRLERLALRFLKIRLTGLEGARGAERAHLGHAPGVQHLHAEVVLERANHRRRARRAADHH